MKHQSLSARSTVALAARILVAHPSLLRPLIPIALATAFLQGIFVFFASGAEPRSGSGAGLLALGGLLWLMVTSYVHFLGVAVGTHLMAALQAGERLSFAAGRQKVSARAWAMLCLTAYCMGRYVVVALKMLLPMSALFLVTFFGRQLIGSLPDILQTGLGFGLGGMLGVYWVYLLVLLTATYYIAPVLTCSSEMTARQSWTHSQAYARRRWPYIMSVMGWLMLPSLLLTGVTLAYAYNAMPGADTEIARIQLSQQVLAAGSPLWKQGLSLLLTLLITPLWLILPAMVAEREGLIPASEGQPR